MSMKIDFERYNPFRRPDWRFERVLRMVDKHPNPGRSTKRDDAWVKGLRQFILQYRNASPNKRERLCYENPGLYFAWLIHERAEDEPEVAFMIEARVLADQSSRSICIETDTIPEAIEWYEHLFFDVRTRLRAQDWIMKHVLVPSVTRAQENKHDAGVRFPRQPLAEPFYDSTLKFFGYFGGPVLIDFMMAGFRRGVIARSSEDVSSWLDQYTSSAAKRRSAMAVGQFEVNKYNVMELFAFHARLMEIERASDDEGRSQTEMEKSVAALMSEMPWAVGDAGAAAFAGTPIALLDEGAAEVRDDELHLLARESIDTLAGSTLLRVREIEAIQMPEPRKKDTPTSQGDPANEDSKQNA